MPLQARLMEEARSGVYVAFDGMSKPETLQMARVLRGHVGGIKLASSSATEHGAPQLVKAVKAAAGGIDIFYDPKFHDIPDQVEKAIYAACSLRVQIVNVHASGGSAMMRAAAAGRARWSKGNPGLPVPKIIAVTVLTSRNHLDFIEEGLFPANMGLTRRAPQEQFDAAGRKRVIELVSILAGLAKQCGLDGVVSSPEKDEVAALIGICGVDFMRVTPGIRPTGSDQNEQKRIATPGQATQNGSNILVVGRPITGAIDPAASADAIVEERYEALLHLATTERG